jgi:methyl-accepting chemotaxis protein
MDTPAARRMSFRLRLTMSVLGLALVPLALLGGVVASQFRSVLTEQVNGGLRGDADSIQQMLESGLSEREKNVESWSEDAIVRGALIYNSYEKSDAGLAALRQRYPQFRALVLFGLDGRAVSASEAAVRDGYAANAKMVRESRWYDAALRGDTRAALVEDVDPVLSSRVLHLALPVLSPADGKPMGVLMAAYDWATRVAEKVDPAVARAVARGHHSFEVIIASDDGTVHFDSNTTRQRPGLPAPEVADLIRRAEPSGVSHADGRVAVIDRSEAGTRKHWVFLTVLDEAEAYAPVQRSVWLTTVLVLTFGGAAVFVSLVMARRLVRPINALNQVVDRIVREGDLTQEIRVETADEIGQLAATFAKMVAKLREIPANLQESTRLLHESVEHLSTSTTEQSQTVGRQAVALQETQVTMQEIKQTSLLAAQKAEAVIKVAERADEIGRQGEIAIERSLSGLTDIRSQVAEIADKITGLTERTRQIGLITETVKDLADQSNMLALNAAIEAVRSGEHGKGFAVVAREIRSLADQSIQATNRVRDILDDISSAIRAAVTITEKGAEKMEAGLVQVKASGENLRELSGIVKDNSAAVRQIAAAVSQQNAGISQISAAVGDLNNLMSDTVTRLQATTDAGNVLRDVSSRVSSIVATYRF